MTRPCKFGEMMILASPLESSNTKIPGSLFFRNSRSKPKVPLVEGVFVQEKAINKKQIIYFMRKIIFKISRFYINNLQHF